MIRVFLLLAAMTTSAAADSTTRWMLSASTKDGDVGFITGLSQDECTCMATKLVGLRTRDHCDRPDWGAPENIDRDSLKCEAYVK